MIELVSLSFSLDMLVTGTMSNAPLEGCPDYPYPRKVSKLFFLLPLKVFLRTTGWQIH